MKKGLVPMMRTDSRSFPPAWNARKIQVACALVFCCVFSAFFCGCYHMGSMMHPQIKTIAISTIRNDTREPLLTELARTQIAARFQSDNSLKLVSKEEADVRSLDQVARVLELQLQHQSFNEYSGSISFRFDWFDLPAVWGTLQILLQHQNLKASVLQCSAFFMVQLSHLYMTTGKTIALTIWTFVRKVMSLLFNTLSRFVTAFLPRSKHLLNLWLQSPSTVIWSPRK